MTPWETRTARKRTATPSRAGPPTAATWTSGRAALRAWAASAACRSPETSPATKRTVGEDRWDNSARSGVPLVVEGEGVEAGGRFLAQVRVPPSGKIPLGIAQ